MEMTPTQTKTEIVFSFEVKVRESQDEQGVDADNHAISSALLGFGFDWL